VYVFFCLIDVKNTKRDQIHEVILKFFKFGFVIFGVFREFRVRLRPVFFFSVGFCGSSVVFVVK